jgi:hypothetical protein
VIYGGGGAIGDGHHPVASESWRRICSTASTAVNISCGALID